VEVEKEESVELSQNLEQALSRQVDLLERACASPLQSAAGDILETFRVELNECVSLYEGGHIDDALFHLSDLETKGSMIDRILREHAMA
jgi:hypothetical protein